MKVAILTQPLGHNYGGLLQAYALQTHLKKKGVEVETLDRRKLPSIKGMAKRKIINSMNLLRGRGGTINSDKWDVYTLGELTKFRDQKLTLSPTIVDEKDLRRYYQNNKFDAFLVGSDQVWRPRYSPSILNFYLDFLNDTDYSPKRIAYGASFGVDDWEYSDQLTAHCSELAQQFNAISVRETTALDVCKEKLGVNATCVVDPTLLLDIEDYELLIEGCGINEHKGCLVSYILDGSLEKQELVDKISNSLNSRVFSIKTQDSIAEINRQNLDRCRLQSVESWLQAFSEAEFVVTDSFHGTVFAIIFHKPFIAIGNSGRGLARFESLLSQLGLIDRLIILPAKTSLSIPKNNIDWSSVDSIRKKLSTSSDDFLMKALYES
ncbi:MAG: hypothetical protein HLUCCX14_07485 [Marinobacter excellens HL-55]|uniref:Polysaccharide pyruvyl transferase domain-containing protein n=1 Tax=Marinobacter excellens HL-55 TaxID=1305731 RepID=A0A0P7ZIC3_9GAMM|nr:MAG: hypothetical protein HLUCCX14_07485 [Marinobacter excellens HL-55]